MDVGLNSRTVSIIRALLESSTPTSIAGLSERLRCSQRMIRYCMPDAQAWLASRGVSLKVKRGSGVRLEVNPAVRHALMSQLTKQNPYALKLSPEQRYSLLSVMLLSSTGPRTIGQIASAVGVSRTTAQKDVTSLKRKMREKYGLTLSTVPGKGVVLSGPEAGLRQAMVDAVMESVNDSELSRLLQDIEKVSVGGKPDNDRGSRLLDMVFSEIKAPNLDFLKRQVRTAELALGREFSETARVALLVHLAIAIGRLKSGHDITMTPEHLESLRVLPEYGVAAAMAREIGERFSVAIPEAEVGYMTLHLAGAKRGMGTKEVTVGHSEIAVRTIVRQMVREAEKHLSRRIADKRLLDGLVVHLIPAYYRIRYSLPIRNPLLQEIKSGYPALFEAASRAAGVFRKALGVELPEEEVAYIAIHIGAALERASKLVEERPKVVVLCASGIGTASLLAS